MFLLFDECCGKALVGVAEKAGQGVAVSQARWALAGGATASKATSARASSGMTNR